MRHPSLQPSDVPVALQLAFVPGQGYEALGEALDVDGATAYRAVQRLDKAGLLIPGERTVARHALRDFLAHGVRYAFFPVLGPETLGVPTAYSAPPLAGEIVSGEDALVWPAANGSTRGQGLQPLYQAAPSLPERSPRLYQALALVDALRVGRARERRLALELLDALLAPADGA
jgi:hypothetical protein